MPTELFIRQVDDEGNETYAPIEAIPDDDIREAPLYKKVVDESINRRKRIRELQDSLKKLDAQTDEPDAVDPEVIAPEPQGLSFKSEDELFNFIETRLHAKQSESEKAANTRKTLIDGLIKEHKLDVESYSVLDSSNNPSETAAYLGRQRVRFDNVSGGDVPAHDDIEGAVASAMRNLGLVEKEG